MCLVFSVITSAICVMSPYSSQDHAYPAAWLGDQCAHDEIRNCLQREYASVAYMELLMVRNEFAFNEKCRFQ
jgi:hypothetical protein